MTGVAIVGCGYWGGNYVRVFNELPQTTVVSVCDQNPDRLQHVKRQYPDVEVTTNIQDIVNDPRVEAVVVATEASSHFKIVSDCLVGGNHVLVEKPLTTRSSEARELVNLADANSRTLMTGHTFLYNAGIRKLKTYVEQDELGQVYYMYSRRTNLGPIRRDVNALWDLAPHDISIFNYLLGTAPEWVSAVGARVLGNGHEDVGFVALSYPGGIIGHVHLSWADPHKVREVVVVGSDKRIVFDDLNSQERVRVFEKGIKPVSEQGGADGAHYGAYQFLLRDGDIISPKIEASEPLKNQCLHFLQCMERGCPALSDGVEGLNVVRTMEAVTESVAKHGAPVELQ